MLLLLDLPPLGTVVVTAALATAYCMPKPNQRVLKIGHYWIWIEAEKVDSRFTILKNYVVSKYIFNKRYL